MLEFDQMLDAGCHFGHLKRKWNPKMAPYIFMEKNGIHLIDLHKSIIKADEAAAALKQVAKSGKNILFVATKKQAKDIVAQEAGRVKMPFVTERWPGGMLTNFATIRKTIKKMAAIDKLMNDEKDFGSISKRERLQIQRERAKLEKNLGSIANLSRLPAALFIIDINREHIAVAEARRLGIPTFALVDTNTNPDLIDFPIPANDDASKSISLIVKYACDAIEEGLNERSLSKDQQEEEDDELLDDNTKMLRDEEDEEDDEGNKKKGKGNRTRRVRNTEDDSDETKRPRRPVARKSTPRKPNNHPTQK